MKKTAKFAIAGPQPHSKTGTTKVEFVDLPIGYTPADLVANLTMLRERIAERINLRTRLAVDPVTKEVRGHECLDCMQPVETHKKWCPTLFLANLPFEALE